MGSAGENRYRNDSKSADEREAATGGNEPGAGNGRREIQASSSNENRVEEQTAGTGQRSTEGASESGRPHTRRWVIVGLVVAAVAVALFTLPVRSYLADFLEWTRGIGYWGPLVVAIVYMFAAVLFLPGAVLTLGAGFLFGLPAGFLSVWVGSNLGAAAAFLIGRFVARDWVARKVADNRKFNALDSAVGEQGLKLVLLTRLAPVFPYNVLNYMFGLTKVRFRDYLVGTIVGMIPGILMYVYIGSGAKSLAAVVAGEVERGTASQVFFWVGLVVVAAVVVLVTRIARRALKDAVAAQSDIGKEEL